MLSYPFWQVKIKSCLINVASFEYSSLHIINSIDSVLHAVVFHFYLSMNLD